ncbi:MAG: protein phosphatase 2C domain-containing protein [Anaerolineae bacterium]|nr:protein phosphatase 2C domain-containing protein [Anaerolineae bacterium]
MFKTLRRLLGKSRDEARGPLLPVAAPVAPGDHGDSDTPPPANASSEDWAPAVVAAAKEAPQPPDALQLEEAKTLFAEGAAFEVGWATHPGRVRDQNEDGVLMFIGEQQSSEAVPAFGLFVLADGMGGHKAGEIASALACRTVAASLLAEVYLPLLTGNNRSASQPSFTETMEAAIQKANFVVHDELPNSGTTLTCGMIVGEWLFVGHVGDSRAYLRGPQDGIRQLSNDHSLVNQLVEIGQLTKEQAAVHPRKNILYRAVGQGDSLRVDVITHRLERGDELLLCSDGLWGLISEEKVWQIVDAASTLGEACRALTSAANAAGGNDNISAVLVRVHHLAV